MKQDLKTTWLLMWNPEGRPILKVTANTARKAKTATPKPYRKYMGEVYVISLEEYERTVGSLRRHLETVEV